LTSLAQFVHGLEPAESRWLQPKRRPCQSGCEIGVASSHQNKKIRSLPQYFKRSQFPDSYGFCGKREGLANALTTGSSLEAVQDLPEIFDCIIFVSYRNGRPWSARQNIWQRLNPRATDQLRRDSDDQSGCIRAFFNRRQRVCAVAIVQGTAATPSSGGMHNVIRKELVRKTRP
jgi:hypothetical protein